MHGNSLFVHMLFVVKLLECAKCKICEITCTRLNLLVNFFPSKIDTENVDVYLKEDKLLKTLQLICLTKILMYYESMEMVDSDINPLLIMVNKDLGQL